jgi:hypothetical protein
MPEPAPDMDYVEAFKSFLASPLRVRYIRYLEDPSYFRVNGKPATYPVEFEAAIQEDTFYVKELTNLWNPTSPPQPGTSGDCWRSANGLLALGRTGPHLGGQKP